MMIHAGLTPPVMIRPPPTRATVMTVTYPIHIRQSRAQVRYISNTKQLLLCNGLFTPAIS